MAHSIRLAPLALASAVLAASTAFSPSAIAAIADSGTRAGPIALVTRAVGEVSDRIITSREVRISDAVDQALSGKPSHPSGFRVLTGQESSFPGEVAKVLDEWIVYLEAKSLTPDPPARADVGASIKKVQEFWGGKPAWQELEASSEELRAMVERKLVARAFEKLKADPQLAPASDEDALSYYRKNRLRFGSLPFSEFKDNIKSFLVKQQTDRRLAEWRDILRRKYKVRNFIAG